MNLGHSVNGSWSLDAQIRGGVTRGGGAKGSNSTGDEKTEPMFDGNVKNVVQP